MTRHVNESCKGKDRKVVPAATTAEGSKIERVKLNLDLNTIDFNLLT
jgi:hypothetical protein